MTIFRWFGGYGNKIYLSEAPIDSELSFINQQESCFSRERIKTTNATSTVYDPEVTYSTDGTTPTKHIFGGGSLVSTIVGTGASSTAYTILTDHLGGSSIILDSSGAVLELMDYFPYGSPRLDEKSGSYNEKRKYIGQQYDDSTGLNYLNARYYASFRGQFISQDPVFWGNPNRQDLANPQNMNSYNYASDNPIVISDPSGRCPMCVFLIPAALGAIGGFARQGISDLIYNYDVNGLDIQNYKFSPAKDYLYSTGAGAVMGAALTGAALVGAGALAIGAVAGVGAAASDLIQDGYIDQRPSNPWAIGFDVVTSGVTAGLIDMTPKVAGAKPQLLTSYLTGAHTANDALSATVDAFSGGVSMGSYNAASHYSANTQRSKTPSGNGSSGGGDGGSYSTLIGLYQSLINILQTYVGTFTGGNNKH